MSIKDQVNILGTVYKIVVKKYQDDEAFERRSIAGYCDNMLKEIVLCDMTTYKGFENEPIEYCEQEQLVCLRHEMVHAFLYQSGLDDNSGKYDCGWARNEEMVDWIAIQGEKVYLAWKEAGAI